MIEGGWWIVQDTMGSCFGRIEGDEFIVGATRILYRIQGGTIYSTEAPASYVADIEGDRAVTPQGDVLFQFVRACSFHR